MPEQLPAPSTQKPVFKKRPYSITLVISLPVIALVSILLGYWRCSTLRIQEKSKKTEPSNFTGSPLLSFSEKDIVVLENWNFLSGKHPRVRFSMNLNSGLKNVKRAVFLYHHLGDDNWKKIDVHSQKDNLYKLTIRDLQKYTRYECMFAVHLQDTILYSNSATFIIE